MWWKALIIEKLWCNSFFSHWRIIGLDSFVSLINSWYFANAMSLTIVNWLRFRFWVHLFLLRQFLGRVYLNAILCVLSFLIIRNRLLIIHIIRGVSFRRVFFSYYEKYLIPFFIYIWRLFRILLIFLLSEILCKRIFFFNLIRFFIWRWIYSFIEPIRESCRSFNIWITLGCIIFSIKFFKFNHITILKFFYFLSFIFKERIAHSLVIKNFN